MYWYPQELFTAGQACLSFGLVVKVLTSLVVAHSCMATSEHLLAVQVIWGQRNIYIYIY